MKYDVVIVGGGIAGLTSAAYLAKAGKKIVLFEKQSRTGGLVQTFERNNVYFDAGLRSIENSGIVFPFLKQLGIDLEFVKSEVSIGIADKVVRLKNKNSIHDYEDFLKSHFPENTDDIEKIIKEISKIMKYMDVIYGIDNPSFLNIKENRKYFLKVIMPWMFKFLFTIRKINKLNEPVDEYLRRFSKNQSLIDIIAQHFFQKTPASFALSYLSLYIDYYYPKGGTASLPDKLKSFIIEKGGIVQTNKSIIKINPEKKIVSDNNGEEFSYDKLVWAGDMKQLYNIIPTHELNNQMLIRKIEDKRSELKPLKGGDSVFTVYLTVDENKEYFSDICTGHFFYTPQTKGLSCVNKKNIEEFMSAQSKPEDNPELKNKLKQYLREYFRLNTFEIAIPVLRDETLAPKGKVGLVVSILFDYKLAKKLDDLGWTKEIKEYLEGLTIDILNDSIYPGIKNKISDYFSSSPLTIEKLTANTDGGITGWAFTNPFMPVENNMLKVAKSVNTFIPSVFQAGQWVYSPSGLPISILTGKIAADKILKS
jgi:phytoene dehydrogenase-like protein